MKVKELLERLRFAETGADVVIMSPDGGLYAAMGVAKGMQSGAFILASAPRPINEFAPTPETVIEAPETVILGDEVAPVLPIPEPVADEPVTQREPSSPPPAPAAAQPPQQNTGHLRRRGGS